MLLIVVISALVTFDAVQGQSRFRRQESFKTEIFLNDNELNSGLYEGMVIGRRRFGRTQIPHGFGIINYFTNDKFHRLNYTGNWVDGQRHGIGTTFFRDGSVFTGQYRDGVEHGEGIIRYENGNVLEGEFRDGKIHGHAVFRYPNGNQREGFFRDNVLDGQVIFTESSGRTIIEVWQNGKRLNDEEITVPSTSRPTTKRIRFPTSSSTTTTTARTMPRRTTTTRPILSTSKPKPRGNRPKVEPQEDQSQFFFPPENQRQRQPKLSESDSMALDLRKVSESSDRQRLLSVFEMVNG